MGVSICERRPHVGGKRDLTIEIRRMLRFAPLFP